jgi:tRNA(fMet)-specific endonuclease VapC
MYCLDTNIISYHFKNQYSVSQNILSLEASDISTTQITLAELLYGAYKSSRVDLNLEIIHSFLPGLKIYSLDDKSSEVYGKQKARMIKLGMVVDDMDLLIASICIANDLTLVTHNLKHFQRIKGLKVEDWVN